MHSVLVFLLSVGFFLQRVNVSTFPHAFKKAKKPKKNPPQMGAHALRPQCLAKMYHLLILRYLSACLKLVTGHISMQHPQHSLFHSTK